MNAGLLGWIGIGGCFGLATLGAAIAMAASGPAVIGAWKKCYIQKKPAPFILVVFAGSCLSNVIYGFILLMVLSASTALNDYQLLTLGLGAGFSIGAAAITQAICSAAAAETYAETGQGFGNLLMVIGIAETVALFAVVFTIMFA